MAPGKDSGDRGGSPSLASPTRPPLSGQSLPGVKTTSYLSRLLDHKPEWEPVLHFDHGNRPVADAVQMIE